MAKWHGTAHFCPYRGSVANETLPVAAAANVKRRTSLTAFTSAPRRCTVPPVVKSWFIGFNCITARVAWLDPSAKSLFPQLYGLRTSTRCIVVTLGCQNQRSLAGSDKTNPALLNELDKLTHAERSRVDVDGCMCREVPRNCAMNGKTLEKLSCANECPSRSCGSRAKERFHDCQSGDHRK